MRRFFSLSSLSRESLCARCRHNVACQKTARRRSRCDPPAFSRGIPCPFEMISIANVMGMCTGVKLSKSEAYRFPSLPMCCNKQCHPSGPVARLTLNVVQTSMPNQAKSKEVFQVTIRRLFPTRLCRFFSTVQRPVCLILRGQYSLLLGSYVPKVGSSLPASRESEIRGVSQPYPPLRTQCRTTIPPHPKDPPLPSIAVARTGS